MTDDALAAAAVSVGTLEREARAAWDALADGHDGHEYQAAMGVVRQAGALRRALETWIVSRATKAQRAAVTR